MSKKIIDWKSGVVSTSGAALATVCDSDTIPDGATATVECHLQGRETTTGEVASCVIHHRAKRVSGTTSLIGTLTSLLTMATGSDAGLATSVPEVVISSNKLRLQVTGVALKNVEWFGDMRVRVN